MMTRPRGSILVILGVLLLLGIGYKVFVEQRPSFELFIAAALAQSLIILHFLLGEPTALPPSPNASKAKAKVKGGKE